MTQNILRSNEIPIGLGPYSNAIHINDLLFVSGTLGFNREDKEVVGNNAGKPSLKPQARSRGALATPAIVCTSQGP